MKYSIIHFFIALCYSLVPVFTWAQGGNSYNLNANNGLPSNLVYGMITDRHGYLWICTDKGVVRYNGYECKLFNQSKGLPTDDVWELLEDRKGRIWLGTISDEIGYIYDNKYHKVYLKDITGIIYPRHIRCFGDGIVFYTSHRDNARHGTICYEMNDTIFKYNIDNEVLDSLNDFLVKKDVPEPFVINDENGKSFCIHNDNIYAIDLVDSKTHKKNNIPQIRKLATLSDLNTSKYHVFSNILVGDNVITYSEHGKSDYLYFTNVYTGIVKGVPVESRFCDNSVYVYINKAILNDSVFYAITRSTIYKCKFYDDLKILDSFKVKSLLNNVDISEDKINTFHKNSIWNCCVGSAVSGVWICYPWAAFSEFGTKIHLKNNTLVGDNINALSFWWNRSEHILSVVDSNYNVKQYSLKEISKINSIIHHNKDTFLISADYPYYFINGKGSIIYLGIYPYGTMFYSAFAISNKEKVFVSAFGFYKNTLDGKVTKSVFFEKDRYTGLAYDKLRNDFWAFNKSRVFIRDSEKNTVIDKKQLAFLGIKNLDAIAIDSVFGNVFLKGYDNIVMYCPERKEHKKIFEKFNFKDESKLLVYKNKLIVVWKYGVLISLIKGDMQLSNPVFYENAKCVSYNSIYGSQVIGGRVIMNTDKGLYSIVMPYDGALFRKNKISDHVHKVILNYNDSVKNIKSNDTVIIDQNKRKLIFDVIYPYGNGHTRYYYSSPMDSVWQELNSNEINLSVLFKPDNHYKIRIYASDDSWKSNIIELSLYIKPYWWQTHSVVRLIWIGTSILGMLIIATAIYLTRRLVLKAAERKHLQMEMELKSIYAQINPHFIFNSLNSALLLVSKNRVDEAYNHIAKFSRLLRSYLKSSRNKYILITEEAENLKNYIELQQTRFKDKFVYEIVVGDAIKYGGIKIPSLLVQPFVENAINHGILQKQGQGTLKVEFKSLPDNTIVCIIEDDGIGRKQSKIINAAREDKKESYGDLMINDLVSIFNRYEKMNIDIMYTDKEMPLTGTIVTITIKRHAS